MTKGGRVALDPDVLGIWREHVPTAKKHVALFRTRLKHRHWVAHGKYWQPKIGMPPNDPVGLADELRLLFDALGIGGWL
jgi:hypothetical protein